MTADPFIVACLQLNPGDDREANLERATEGVREAKARGASLVVLPEYATFLHASSGAMRSSAAPEEGNPTLLRLRRLAEELDVWILIGSLVLDSKESDKLTNRSFLVSAKGDIAARYDKIHMFDATLPGGRTIRESSTYRSGDRAVVATTPWARIGLSICYDVRFASLYRALAQAGAEVLAVPSAFTKVTGMLHWKSLLQARAIENGAYVVAAATCGSHPGGHQTYGHAMIVDPNGQVIAEAGDEPGLVCATIDIASVAAARARLPSLTHDRPFKLEQA